MEIGLHSSSPAMGQADPGWGGIVARLAVRLLVYRGGIDGDLGGAPLGCSRVEQEWPVAVPPHGKAIVRLEVRADEPGPFNIELAFWTAEPRALRRVPFAVRGEAK